MTIWLSVALGLVIVLNALTFIALLLTTRDLVRLEARCRQERMLLLSIMEDIGSLVDGHGGHGAPVLLSSETTRAIREHFRFVVFQKGWR